MSEKDQGKIIPFPMSAIGAPAVIPGEIVNKAPSTLEEKPFTIVVVAPKPDLSQYAATAREIVIGDMSLITVENATSNTGGQAFRVSRVPLSISQPANLKKGDILGDSITWAAVVGDQDVPFIVTTELVKVNPITGEPLPSSNQNLQTPNNILQFPQNRSPIMESNSTQTDPGDTNYDRERANSPFLKAA